MKKQGIRFIFILVLVLALFILFSIPEFKLSLAPPPDDLDGVCGDGILQPDAVGRKEICDYAAVDEENNSYGIYCGHDCLSVLGSDFFGWRGCKDTSVHVCTELVSSEYFTNNPKCNPKNTCGGYASYDCTNLFCPRVDIGLQRGDLNNDGLFDETDLSMFNFPSDTYWSNWSQLMGNPVELADVNGDGEITTADYSYLEDYISNGNPTPVPLNIEVENPLRGDLNKDGFVGTFDIEFLEKYLFYNTPVPDSMEIADVNNDSVVNYDDFDYLIDNVYLLGPAPVSLASQPIPDQTISNPERGDLNADGNISLEDVNFLIDYLYKGGPAPDPLEVADANYDRYISNLDTTYLINYLYKGGPAPPQIFYCNTTFDDLYCEGTLLFSCNESRGAWMWIELGEVVGYCNVTFIDDDDSDDDTNITDDSNITDTNETLADEIEIIIFSPKHVNYSSTNISLKVGDRKDLTHHWKYSLNTGLKINFIPNTTIIARKGSNTLRIYASESYDFSEVKQRIVVFWVVEPSSNPYCGDSVCDSNENSLTCPSDCGSTTYSYCGDGTCDLYEDALNCAADCGVGDGGDADYSYCGDGVCDSDETISSCSSDCKEKEKSYTWIFIILIILIVVGIILVIFFLMKKHKKIDSLSKPPSLQGYRPGPGRPRPPFARRPPPRQFIKRQTPQQIRQPSNTPQRSPIQSSTPFQNQQQFRRPQNQ